MSRNRVLIIDGNTDVREMHAEYLRFQGFETFEAADGLQGLQEAAKHKPDVVLVDIRLPLMDGIAVARNLNLKAATAPIPVICLSAYPSPDYQTRALAAGCSLALAKSYDPQDLVAAVEQVLSATGLESGMDGTDQAPVWP